MTKYVALLRGVGGPRRTPSADLRDLGVQLGYSDVATYIATGNLLFRSERAAVALRRELHPRLRERFGFDIPVLVLSERTLARAVSANPYSDSNPSLASVTFLSTPIPPALRDELRDSTADGERLDLGAPNARWLYADFHHGHQNSKLARRLLSPIPGVVATTRNLRTATALRDRLRVLGEASGPP